MANDSQGQGQGQGQGHAYSVIKSPIIIGSETVIRAERYGHQSDAQRRTRTNMGEDWCLARFRFNQSFLKF